MIDNNMMYCALCSELKGQDRLHYICSGTYICYFCTLTLAADTKRKLPISYPEEWKQNLNKTIYIEPVAPPLYQQWVYTDIEKDDIRPQFYEDIHGKIAKAAFNVVELTLEDKDE